jgi:hypothetical protein
MMQISTSAFDPKTDIQHGAHGGLEKQARRPHGHSHTKHEDGDGVHWTAVLVLRSEMLSNTPIVTSY